MITHLPGRSAASIGEAADEPYALSPKAAAKRLGIDVSTLYRHYGAAMRRGAIRTLRIGRAVRIIWQSLLAYIEAGGDTHGRA